MRRLAVVILILGLAAPVLGLAILSNVRPVVLARVAVGMIEAVTPPRALAQETMEFEPVPPESVRALERRRSARRPAAAPEASEPSLPPLPPVPPEAPEPTFRSGDITRVGNDIHIDENEIVRGTVMAWRGDVTVDGTVHGDVVAVGGDVYLNPTARVDGDVVCVGGELHEESGAYVSGERVTVLGGGGTKIAPRLRTSRPRLIIPRPFAVGWGGLTVIGSFLRFAIAVGLTLLIVWIFQGRIAAGAGVLKRQPALSLGIGALVHALFIPSVIALAIVVAILCITIIGIPLALAALLGYALFFAVFWLFGLVVGATVIGERVLANRGTPAGPLWQSALLGVLLVGGLRFVGRMFEAMGLVGSLGELLVVLSVLVAIVLGTMGGGAWLKWEFEEGLFGRWRGRRLGMSTAGGTAGPPPAYGPPPDSPYGPPAAPPSPPPSASPGTEPPPSS